ncbi:MAG: hypothetical protein AAGG56_03005 [Pseudomonadota bacterium]
MKSFLQAAAKSLDDGIEARMLFQANAKARIAFDGQILGKFVRNGPNPWDTYRFTDEPGGTIRVFPTLKIQIAPKGPIFRMRAQGGVLRVAWVPPEDLTGGDPAALRAAFLEHCVTGYSNAHGIGATAFIVKTLETGRRPGS